MPPLRLSLALLLAALVTPLLAQNSANPAPSKLPAGLADSLEAHQDLVYARYGERELQLDLYRPKNATGPLPGIVCIHGGGWYKGKRGDHAELAQALAARGFVAVTISYRLSGESPFPAQIGDCKAAVRWLRENAAIYGVNADAIGAIGHSAGGQLSALLATSGGAALEGTGGNAGQSSAIQAAVAMGAQADFEAQHIRENHLYPDKLAEFWQPFLGGAYREVPERYRAASPATYLDAHDPPLVFIAGETDHPSTQAASTRLRLMKLGVPTGLTVIQGAGHGIFQKQAWFDQVINTSAAFFTLHLKQRSAPPVVCDVPGIFAKDARWQLLGIARRRSHRLPQRQRRPVHQERRWQDHAAHVQWQGIAHAGGIRPVAKKK